MLKNILKHISIEAQGIIASILGIILILGTLGKLGILQGILNSIMILAGIILLIWGLYTSNGYSNIKNFLDKPQVKK